MEKMKKKAEKEQAEAEKQKSEKVICESRFSFGWLMALCLFWILFHYKYVWTLAKGVCFWCSKNLGIHSIIWIFWFCCDFVKSFFFLVISIDDYYLVTFLKYFKRFGNICSFEGIRVGWWFEKNLSEKGGCLKEYH